MLASATTTPAILVARQLLVLSLRYHTPSVDASSPNRLRRLNLAGATACAAAAGSQARAAATAMLLSI